MEFFGAFSEVFFNRWESAEAMRPLVDSQGYMEIRQNIDVILDGMPQEEAEAMRTEIRRLCDAEAQFFFRMGIQDGVRLMGKDFLGNGIA